MPKKALAKAENIRRPTLTNSSQEKTKGVCFLMDAGWFVGIWLKEHPNAAKSDQWKRLCTMSVQRNEPFGLDLLKVMTSYENRKMKIMIVCFLTKHLPVRKK